MWNDLGQIGRISAAVLTGLLCLALYTDMKSGKIYNKLTLPCMFLGIILRTAGNGLEGLLQGLGGILLVLLLYLAFAPATGIGGGDAKLMMAVGALIGIDLAIWALLYSAIAGGVLALLVMLRHRMLALTVCGMARNFFYKTMLRTNTNLADGSTGLKFRYSPAIALGVIATIISQQG